MIYHLPHTDILQSNKIMLFTHYENKIGFYFIEGFKSPLITLLKINLDDTHKTKNSLLDYSINQQGQILQNYTESYESRCVIF